MLKLKERVEKTEESYCVYKHTNKINGKVYVGLTKMHPELRWGNSGKNYKNKCPRFWNAITKYGWENFEHTVIATRLTKSEACALETTLIKELKTQEKEFGYNILEGGIAPAIPPETRAKMSKAMMGNKNGLGHSCSEEKKKKISDSQKGRRFTPEHAANISKAKAGKPHASPTEETRKKISDAHIKTPVFCRETETIYPSIQECAKQLNLYATNVCKCCKGKIKSTGGYHFTYSDNSTIKA